MQPDGYMPVASCRKNRQQVRPQIHVRPPSLESRALTRWREIDGTEQLDRQIGGQIFGYETLEKGGLERQPFSGSRR